MIPKTIQPNRCCKMIADTNIWSNYHQCSRTKNLVERDGKFYCKQHDPEEVAKRDAAKRAKWRAELKDKQEQWKKDDLIHTTHPKLVELAHLAHKLILEADNKIAWHRDRKGYTFLVDALIADGIDITKEKP